MNYNGAPWSSSPEGACAAGVDKAMADYGDDPDKPSYTVVSVGSGVCNLRITYKNGTTITANCRIPDDCIDPKRYPLFMARAVLQELIESLQSTRGVKLC